MGIKDIIDQFVSQKAAAQAIGNDHHDKIADDSVEQQELNRAQAEQHNRSYMNVVQGTFQDRPAIHHEILDIIRACENGLGNESNDTVGLIKRAFKLFEGDKKLVLGLNSFLPEGFVIEYPSNGEAPFVVHRTRDGKDVKHPLELPSKPNGRPSINVDAPTAEVAPQEEGGQHGCTQHWITQLNGREPAAPVRDSQENITGTREDEFTEITRQELVHLLQNSQVATLSLQRNVVDLLRKELAAIPASREKSRLGRSGAYSKRGKNGGFFLGSINYDQDSVSDVDSPLQPIRKRPKISEKSAVAPSSNSAPVPTNDAPIFGTPQRHADGVEPSGRGQELWYTPITATPTNAENMENMLTEAAEKLLSAKELASSRDEEESQFSSSAVRHQEIAEAVTDGQSSSSSTSHENSKASKRMQRILRDLAAFNGNGIHSVCHKPKVFPNAMKLTKEGGEVVADYILDELAHCFPEYSKEIPSRAMKAGVSEILSPIQFRLVNPTRVERGYFKSHLKSEFVDSFASSLPSSLRIKRNVTKKGIAFISTNTATLSHTHYDQDTSFLLVLTGTKEILCAPPSMAERLRINHPVIAHSSIFEDINPFFAPVCTLWDFTTLHAGDGYLLPKGWIHAVKSTPGTLALSFQVEASGVDDAATSPFIRRSQSTAPEDLRHLSRIEMEREIDMSSDEVEVEDGQDEEHGEDEESVGKEEEDGDELDNKDSDESEANEGDKGGPDDDRGPLREKQADIMPHEVVSAKGIVTSSRRSLRQEAAMAKMQNGRRQSGEASNSRKHSTSPTPPPIPKTRKVVLKAAPDGVRRSSREKYWCGVEGCPHTFPVNDGLMWVLMLALETRGKGVEKNLPLVPTHNPKHLVCVHCRPLETVAIFHPVEMLTEEDKADIRGWDQYLYYTATRVDYLKIANLI